MNKNNSSKKLKERKSSDILRPPKKIHPSFIYVESKGNVTAMPIGSYDFDDQINNLSEQENNNKPFEYLMDNSLSFDYEISLNELISQEKENFLKKINR